MPRFFTAGESHGRALIALISSFPAGFDISLDLIHEQMTRRRLGFGRGRRMQIETDTVKVLSGLRHGRTLGSPIAMLIENRDWTSWKKIMDPHRPLPTRLTPSEDKLAHDVYSPRPGHADLAGAVKYHTHDVRNVLERASARETAARVACGAVARQLLAVFGIRVASHVIAIGTVRSRRKKYDFQDIAESADASPVRCLEADLSERMMAHIKQAMAKRETVGGIFEVRASGLPLGLGNNSQWRDRLDAALAAAIVSIPSVKGVEIGDAFANSRRPGSRVHDRIYYRAPARGEHGKGFHRRSNSAGGIEGGMSNGSDIIMRGACKPISTLMQPLDTVNLMSKEPTRAIVERSDTCIVPAAAVIGEAMAAMVLAEAFLDKFGGDSCTELEAAYHAYLDREF